MRRPMIVLGLVVGISLFVGCGQDDPAAPDPVPTTQSSRTIPPAGGTVSIESENGTVLSVSFPAGAVLEPTAVTLRAVAPPAGVRARFAVEPSGLDLLVPATFAVVLPDDQAVDGLGLWFERSARIPVPTEVDPVARTLTAELFHLGFGDLDAVAAATRRAADTGDEFIDVDEFECQLIAESLTDAILRAQAFVGPFPPDLATPLIQQYRTALLLCEAGALADQETAIRSFACDKAEGAALNAQVLLVETAQELKQSLGFLLAAEGVVQASGAECALESSLLETEFDEFLQSYIARVTSPDFVASFPNWDALWRELIVCLDIAAMAQEFGVPQAQATIEQQLFPALFARLHEVAADACEEDENNSFFVDILTGGHALDHPIAPNAELPVFTGLDEAALVDEMHRCGSSLRVDARTADDHTLDSAVIRLVDRAGSVRVIDKGKVVLTSDISNFTCDGVIFRPTLRVRAEIPGVLPDVQLGTLSGQKTIGVEDVLNSLPVPVGGTPPDEFDLVIERDRSVCGIAAQGAVELCRVTVNTTGFEGGMSGTWSGGCPAGPVSGTFEITVAADGTVTGEYNGSASGSIEGLVSADGTLDASANGTAGGCTWSGTLTIAGGALRGSGGWTCGSAGCGGSFSSD